MSKYLTDNQRDTLWKFVKNTHAQAGRGKLKVVGRKKMLDTNEQKQLIEFETDKLELIVAAMINQTLPKQEPQGLEGDK